MSARQPRHPVECQGHIVVCEAVWDLVSANQQGQQQCALRKQAGHTTASDRRSYQLKKRLAMQEPSTQDVHVTTDPDGFDSLAFFENMNARIVTTFTDDLDLAKSVALERRELKCVR